MTNISSELKTQRYPDQSTGKTGMEGCISPISLFLSGCQSQARGTFSSIHHPAIGQCPSLRARGPHREASSRFASYTRLKPVIPYVSLTSNRVPPPFFDEYREGRDIASCVAHAFHIAPLPLRNMQPLGLKREQTAYLLYRVTRERGAGRGAHAEQPEAAGHHLA
jgi:hypothetical protein